MAIHKRTKLTFLKFISSEKFIKSLALIEFIFYGFLIYERINRIYIILGISKGLREVINIVDYENGWSFIYLLLLVISCALTLKLNKAVWLIKQVGLICILITLGFIIPYVGIVVTLLIVYYSLNKISFQFGILKVEKMKYHLISVISVVILLAGYLFINILDY